MRETLRIQPTAIGRIVTPVEDTTIGGGKYSVKAGNVILLLTWNAHRDPLVYGDDVRKLLYGNFTSSLNISCFYQANEFRPERMLDDKFKNLPVCPPHTNLILPSL